MEDPRPDLETFLNEESAKHVGASPRVIAWPKWLRIAVGIAIATSFLLCEVAVLFLLDFGTEQGANWGVVLGVALSAVVLYGWFIYWALDPIRATRFAIRGTASYPTNAPGYRTEGPRRSRAGDNSP